MAPLYDASIPHGRERRAAGIMHVIRKRVYGALILRVRIAFMKKCKKDDSKVEQENAGLNLQACIYRYSSHNFLLQPQYAVIAKFEHEQMIKLKEEGVEKLAKGLGRAILAFFR